jgi:hypothetical protein
MHEAAARKLELVDWSHDADGPEGMLRTIDSMLHKRQSGAIILSHGNKNARHDAEDVRAGVAAAWRAGYRFVSVDQLIHTPRAKPQRTILHANAALGERISVGDILTADCHNNGGGARCRAEVLTYSYDRKSAILKRFKENTPR